jgi:hypothetical protein
MILDLQTHNECLVVETLHATKKLDSVCHFIVLIQDLSIVNCREPSVKGESWGLL